jgi:D-alanyl-D-alanine carboxypeptidase/D-alanyl-D-alanine-endopeptidase (penicillin-binding protein 4)
MTEDGNALRGNPRAAGANPTATGPDRRQFVEGSLAGVAAAVVGSSSIAPALGQTSPGTTPIAGDADIDRLLPQISNWDRWGADDQLGTLTCGLRKNACGGAQKIASGLMPRSLFLAGYAVALSFALAGSCGTAFADPADSAVPPEITAIVKRPQYAGATWGLRAVEAQTDRIAASLGPDVLFFTGSVRKLFSVGVALNALGPDHRFSTPVYRRGEITAAGALDGDLILVASGDLTLGGRNQPDGTIAFTDFDHTESNALGSSILTDTDPLAGIVHLARQVAAAGVKAVGDVVVDDRLFDHFRVPNGNVLITPVVLNDNLIDVTILPTEPGRPATVDWRPKTAAFTVRSEVTTVAAGQKEEVVLKLSGDDKTVGIVKGTIPVGFKPGLPGVQTLVQTFPIQDPSAALRTVFIEALVRAGVTVRVKPTGPNPISRLPARGSYAAGMKVAELVSLPYAQYARLILKVSHNLGANLSLMLFGLTKDARTIATALATERKTLTGDYGLSQDGFDFPTNGSGSPDSRAKPSAVTGLLQAMQKSGAAGPYFDALPVLASTARWPRSARTRRTRRSRKPSAACTRRPGRPSTATRSRRRSSPATSTRAAVPGWPTSST